MAAHIITPRWGFALSSAAHPGWRSFLALPQACLFRARRQRPHTPGSRNSPFLFRHLKAEEFPAGREWELSGYKIGFGVQLNTCDRRGSRRAPAQEIGRLLVGDSEVGCEERFSQKPFGTAPFHLL